jgi:outer membrane protein assembly factor BamB
MEVLMKKLVSLVLAVLIAVPVITGMAATPTWPMPFYDSAHTNCAPNINITLPLERQWVFFTDSKRLGMPIATDENVFVTDNTGTIYCLTKDLGEEVWRFNLGVKRPISIAIVGNTIGYVTTSSDLSTVLSGMGAGGRRQRRRPGSGGGGGGGSGDVTEDAPKNYIGNLDMTTGKSIKQKELNEGEDFMLSQATTIGDKIYVVYIQLDEKFNSGPSKLVCLSANDLSTLWSVEHPKMLALPITYCDGKLVTEGFKVVFNEDTQQPEMKDAELTALNATDGKVLWAKTLDANEVLMVPSYANGVFYAPKIIIPEDDGGGGGGGRGGPFRMPDSYLSAYKADTGEQIWTTKMPSEDLAFGVPAITPKGIVMQAMISKTILFDKDTGDIKWSTPTAGGFSLSGMQFVCTDKYVISTRGSKLSFINLGSGKEDYVEELKFQAGLPIPGSTPTMAFSCIANDMVYIAADKLMAYGKKIIGIKSDPAVVRFEQIEVGQKKTKNVRVIYNGDGEISGKAECSQPWMKLNSSDYKLAVQNYELTIDATKLEPGEYKGEIYIKASVGEAKIPVVVRVVPKPPLRLDINLEEETLTNKNPFKITGLTVPGAKLSVSGRPVNVASDGAFSAEIPLKEGLNRLEFEAVDSKGAKAITIRIVFLDTKKPILQVSLSEGQEFLMQPISFSGRTEPGSKLRVNGEPYDVTESGEFEVVIENLEDGNHTLKLVSTDKAGNVTSMERNIVVDTKPLELNLKTQSPIFTKVPEVVVTGTTKPNTRVIAQIEQAMLGMAMSDDEGNFELKLTLKDEGEYNIRINASTGVKTGTKEILVIYDKTPPTIRCDLPTVVNQSSLTIYGFTDPDLEVTVTVGTTTRKVKADLNGKFQASFTLKEGLNPVTMTTVDRAGNEGKYTGFVKFEAKKEVQKVTIVLTLDKTAWTINGESQKALAVAPTATKLPADLKGNTYMPIKEVAQALFADVAWDGNEKKVTLTQKLPDGTTNIVELWINKKTAKINGKEVPISSNGKLYPTIYNGKTLLPLRFVADALGCTVNYEASTKVITLTYPK